MSAIHHAFSMSSMLEIAAALCAGLGVTAATLAIAVPPPTVPDDAIATSWLERFVRSRWAEESALAAGAGWTDNGAAGLAILQVMVAGLGGCAAALRTGPPVLAAAVPAAAVAF